MCLAKVTKRYKSKDPEARKVRVAYKVFVRQASGGKLEFPYVSGKVSIGEWMKSGTGILNFGYSDKCTYREGFHCFTTVASARKFLTACTRSAKITEFGGIYQVKIRGLICQGPNSSCFTPTIVAREMFVPITFQAIK